MKHIRKLLFFSLAILYIGSGHSFAQLQEMPKKKNVIAANPLAILFREFDVQYERALTRRLSIELTPSVVWASASTIAPDLSSVNVMGIGGGIAAALNIYILLKKPVLEGLYVYPTIGGGEFL